jgi:hypothetical protein
MQRNAAFKCEFRTQYYQVSMRGLTYPFIKPLGFLQCEPQPTQPNIQLRFEDQRTNYKVNAREIPGIKTEEKVITQQKTIQFVKIKIKIKCQNAHITARYV